MRKVEIIEETVRSLYTDHMQPRVELPTHVSPLEWMNLVY